MTPEELKQTPEPPVGTIVELQFDYMTPEHFRRYSDGWMTLRDVFNANFTPTTWEQITNATFLTRAFLWEMQTSLVAHDDMEDGKRYAVTVEGEFDERLGELRGDGFAFFGAHGLTHATRIVKIGGDS